MDNEIRSSEPRRSGAFSRTSSVDSSLRRRSSGASAIAASQIDDDTESESVSQAGDIGDRAIQSIRYSKSGRAIPNTRYSGSGHSCFLIDDVIEAGVGVSIQEDSLLKSLSSRSCNADLSDTILPSDNVHSHSPNHLQCVEDQPSDDKKELPCSLQYVSCLLHLAVFGILGVLTRYLLQKLFGPGVAGVTSDHSIVYLDLPSNMVGSFLMGWFGVIFKGAISRFSDLLAIGLTTGYLGSLTTFSGWNQKMLDLSVHGHWVSSSLGFLLGLFLAAYSLIFGVETARGFQWLLERPSSGGTAPISGSTWRVDSRERRLVALLAMALILGLLWGLSGALEKHEFSHGGNGAKLWLACLVGPVGVWVRWFLARLNGRGLGATGYLKWVPFGTLLANVSAACIMAALATLKKVVRNQRCETVATGIQLGFLGCLSTVSTFIVEFDAMRQSSHPWRAYAYAVMTIIPSFALGTLLYSVPVWAEGYD